MTDKNYGAGVSAYLDVDGRNFETTVYQASKPVLDSELNQIQDIDQARTRSLFQLAQSGWLCKDILETSSHSEGIFITSAVANQLKLPPLKAILNGWPIIVDNTGGTTNNVVSLGAPPAGAGARQTDLVILEVWRRLLSASPSTVGKSQTARIWRNGNVKIDAADDLTLNYVDDILDANVGAETTKRVQVQYRLRVVTGIDLDAYPSGIEDPLVVAFSVPTNAATPDGAATAFNYTLQSSAGDAGLWLAGDGNPANTIGSVDGYMYALPVCAVFRRNAAAFARDTNHNGGSARPDSLTATIIDARDLMDLRTNISTTGWDLNELLSKNVNLVLDNTLRTEQATTPFVGGMQGHTVLWADEIGPIDNTGAEHLGIPGSVFDGARRRFSDRVILETVVVKYASTDPANSSAPTWNNGSILTIDPTALPIYPHASANFISAAPSQIAILDVISWVGVDTSSSTRFHGYFDDSTGPTGLQLTHPSEGEVLREILGLGGTGTVTLGLGFDTPGATQDMYVTLLISYPGGSDTSAGGLNRTPTGDFGANSVVIENQVAQLPVAAPYLFNSVVSSIEQPHREALITYRTLTQTFSQIIGDASLFFPQVDHTILYVPERVADTPTPVITDVTTGDTYTGGITISEDGRTLLISTLAADWSPSLTSPVFGTDQVDVTFQAVRPIPNNSVQCTIYYETRAAQTIRDALLGTTLTVIPRFIAPYLYTLVTGSGSLDEGYPFPLQYVQSPGVYDSSSPTYGGDHELDGLGVVSIADFNAETGFLQVPTLIPAVPEPQSLTFLRAPGDIDIEERSFFKEVPAGYIPSAFGQPLSDPKRHKNVLPMIAELAADGPIGPKGTFVVVLISRWARFDSDNFVGFDADLAANFTSASVYRLKGNPLSTRRA